MKQIKNDQVFYILYPEKANIHLVSIKIRMQNIYAFQHYIVVNGDVKMKNGVFLFITVIFPNGSLEV